MHFAKPGDRVSLTCGSDTCLQDDIGIDARGVECPEKKTLFYLLVLGFVQFFLCKAFAEGALH